MMNDPYYEWREALEGRRVGWDRRKVPPCGKWRFPWSDRKTRESGQELVATWQDDNGTYFIARNKFGRGIIDEHDPEILWEIFVAEHYAIPDDVYFSVLNGGDFPPEHTVRVRLPDVWSMDLAREILAKARVMAIETGFAIGDNNPPFEPGTADKALAAAILKKGEELKSLLDSWGGEPRNQVEAELVGSYVNVFRNFEKQANAYHASEKAPHLEAGRAVDAKWFPPVRDRAIACATKAKQITEAFKRAEDARKKEEIDRLLADMRKRAEQEAKITGEPVADIPEIKIEPTIIAAQRGRKTTPKVWQVVNPIEFGTYILNMESIPPDMLECLNKLARKMGAAGVNALPGCEFKEKL